MTPTLLLEIVAIALGAFFMFVSSLGVLRLDDFYLRVHAPTKAATVGLVFLLVALALAVRGTVVVAKAALTVLFIAATVPAGAHVLARAAHRCRVRGDAEPDEYASSALGEPMPEARRGADVMEEASGNEKK